MEQRQFFLRDILTVVFKHLKLIIALPLIVFAVVFVGNYVWPPTFESSAQVRLTRGREVSQADPTVTQAAQTINMIQMTVEDINSELNLIHSKDLLRSVVEELDLHKNGDFPYGDSLLTKPFELIKGAGGFVLGLLQLTGRPSAVDRAMDQLDERLVAEPVRDSYVIEIRCRMGSAALAQEVLDKVLTVYQERHIEVFQNDKSVPFFEQQVTRVEEKLRAAQAELQGFRKGKSISLMDTEKELLLEQYTDAKKVLSQLAETQSALEADSVDSNLISSLSSQTDSTVVREMQLRLLELLLERNRVVQSLGPKHPTVASLKEQLQRAQQDLIEAIASTKQITENKLNVAQARLEQLNETKAELEKLEQEVAILSDNYEYYSQKLEESRVADMLATESISNIKVVSSPAKPIEPIRPRRLLNLALALIGGAIAALAIAFFLDYLDHGLKTPEDVEYYAKVPLLASFFNKAGQPLDSREAERLAILLDTATGEGGSQILQVMNSVPGEGSDGVANGLADVFANDPEAPTLLVDFAGDVGRGRNARYGLTDVLLDQTDFDEVFASDGNLTVVGRGSHREYPSYLWSSERMQKFVQELRRRYKHIVFHVGPALQSHDALKLARYADGVILVIKADATRREVVSRALDLLKEAKVTGAVLTERTQKIPQAVYRRI